MRGLICGTVAVVGLLGCAASSPPSNGHAGVSTAAVASTEPALVRVVGKDFAFDSAHSVPAGLVAIRFVNEGRSVPMLGVARRDSGKTAADVFQALSKNTSMEWCSELGGPGAVSPGDSATQYAVLGPGIYSMIWW